MKKLILISVCFLGLAIAGNAATTSSIIGQTPVKKEAPAVKKDMKTASATNTKHKKAPVKKPVSKKNAATPVKPATPIMK